MKTNGEFAISHRIVKSSSKTDANWKEISAHLGKIVLEENHQERESSAD